MYSLCSKKYKKLKKNTSEEIVIITKTRFLFILDEKKLSA